mmetsp:Transcript_8666/g.20945  ORF Transcript_8666/g.20945 Transcript_8666/m.20945 type:complete len:240 (-) Transcript_8666:779-1498(-)
MRKLKQKAQKKFRLIVYIVCFESSKNGSRVSDKFSCTSTTSAACTEIEEPHPMAKPQSAWASAPASFSPSPTKNTLLCFFVVEEFLAEMDERGKVWEAPCSWSCWTNLVLSCGRHSDRTYSSASGLSTWGGGAAVRGFRVRIRLGEDGTGELKANASTAGGLTWTSGPPALAPTTSSLLASRIPTARATLRAQSRLSPVQRYTSALNSELRSRAIASFTPGRMRSAMAIQACGRPSMEM